VVKYGLMSCNVKFEGAGNPRNLCLATDRSKRFVPSPAFRPVLEPNQPVIRWIPKDLSPGLKLSGRKNDHSIQSNAVVKKEWSNTYSCPTCLDGVKRGTL